MASFRNMNMNQPSVLCFLPPTGFYQSATFSIYRSGGRPGGLCGCHDEQPWQDTQAAQHHNEPAAPLGLLVVVCKPWPYRYRLKVASRSNTSQLFLPSPALQAAPSNHHPHQQRRGSADGQRGEACVTAGRGAAGHRNRNRNRHRYAAVPLAPAAGHLGRPDDRSRLNPVASVDGLAAQPWL